MKNITPRRRGIISTAAGMLFVLIGAWLIWSDFDTLIRFLKLFAGFFLLLVGLGILGLRFR